MKLSSEAELKKALKKLKKQEAHLIQAFGVNRWYIFFINDNFTASAIAMFDIRKIISQRAPLKGIKKGFAKLITPKRKKRK